MVNITHRYNSNDSAVVPMNLGQNIRRPFQPRNVNAVSAPSPGEKASLSGFFFNGFIFELCFIRECMLGPLDTD